MWTALLLLLLRELAIEVLEVSLHNEAHDDRETVRGDANRVRVRIRWTPGLRPYVSATGRAESRSAPARAEQIRGERECTHEPATFPSCENALINASATARFEGGRAMVLLTHARKMMKPA